MVAPALAERPPSQLMSLRTPVYRNSPSRRRPKRELQEGKRERGVGLKMGVDVGTTPAPLRHLSGFPFSFPSLPLFSSSPSPPQDTHNLPLQVTTYPPVHPISNAFLQVSHSFSSDFFNLKRFKLWLDKQLVDEVGIMLLYEGEWVRDGNVFYFKGSKDIRKQYGVQISYDKAWRAKELALGSIRGSPEESYNTLSSYCYVLEQKNLGTITDIVTDCDNQFKYFFMSIGASLVGFHTSIRPVIAVDGTFLKAKYLGTLFIATCKDGNNQIYPLAFGIGDLENDASWEWFLQKLHDALGHIDDLFVISDRHGSIEKAVHKVFPHARHGVCTYHVGQNLKTKFKNPAIHKLFHDAAHAYHVSEFNFIFGQLEMIDQEQQNI
ncbi:hypothetical protein CK203_104740 [Vitis vinifera]|uniref:MULE transposase domain-containing protein n=1 Tax=Vitis vinifera TaxID=29760 RepID=A0A438E2E3_VITVI|nr:hypothetical protein CK203_104740 [Vitis vinifera]